ncbi:MAG: hypothetical protein KF702_05180 [Gammaproteobacteria bacterium]|nr:hypothetical protein [Gammaproteobacteria bacterium]
MKNIFTKHPHSIGETYFEHMKFASYFGFNMVLGGLACLIHAIFPFFFQKTGSNILLAMTYHFVDRMPTIEPRVVEISQLVASKRASVFVPPQNISS